MSNVHKMRLTRRDFLKGSLGLAGAGLLAACAAPAAPAPAAPAPAAPAANATAPKAAAAPAQGGKLGLLLVDWNEDVRTLMDKDVIPAFQAANPGVTVEVDYTGWDQLDPKVMTAYAGGLAPDLFMADYVEFGPKYYAKGILAPLDEFVAAAGGAKVLDDFYAKAIDEGCKSKDGKLVALPYLMDNRALFYRKDLLKEAGLDPEKPPYKWEDFRQAAIKQTKRNGDNFERAGWQYNTAANSFPFQAYVQFLWQNGGALYEPGYEKVAFNSDAGVGALEFWTKLIREDKVGPVEDMPDVGDMSPFVAGTKAMDFGNYGNIANIKKYKPELSDQLGVAVMEGKAKGSLWYANAYLLTKGKQMELAWKLLSHLVLNDDSFKKYHTAMGGMPPRKSIAAALPYLGPLHKVLLDDVMNAPASHTTAPVPWNLEVLDRVAEAIQKAIFGKATPQQALSTAADEATKIVERNLKG